MSNTKVELTEELRKSAIKVTKGGEWGALPRGVRRERTIRYEFADGTALVGYARNEMGYAGTLVYHWEVAR